MVNLIRDDKVVPKYPKIQTVFKRDPDNNYRTLLIGEYSLPEFEYLADNDWIATEKVDGTNIRVHWDGNDVWFGGKTERAQIPPFLLDELQELFPDDLMRDYFGETPATLYGEGFGNKIQKAGSEYIPDGVNFILFDVLINDYWLERKGIGEIAVELGIASVPIWSIGNLYQAIVDVQWGFDSMVANNELTAEGLIMFPEVQLFNRNGDRVITKIKHKDFR